VMTPRSAGVRPGSCGWAWAAGPRSSSTPLTLSDLPREAQRGTAEAGALAAPNLARTLLKKGTIT